MIAAGPCLGPLLVAALAGVRPLVDVQGEMWIGGKPAAYGAVILDAVDEPNPSGSRPEVAVLDLSWLSFVPRVQVVPVGTTLRVHNRDDEPHTIHGVRGVTQFNVATVPGGAEQRVALRRPGVLRIGCDMHASMHAFVIVTPGATRWAATDERGKFRIASVPAGRYRVRPWHADLPPPRAEQDQVAVTMETDVGPGDPPLVIRLPRGGKRPPPRAPKPGR